MKVVLVDTGRGRNLASVELWRSQLQLEDGDDLALLSWNHPRVALPVVDQLVFGPTLDWGRPEPVRPNVTVPRRVPGPVGTTAHLSRTDPRRVAAALRRRTRRLTRAASRRLTPITRRLPQPLASPMSALSSSSPLGVRLRSALGVRSDGVPTDFAIAVARSAQAAELASWADVVVPFDARSRKAAWVLAKRVSTHEAPMDMTTAVKIIEARRRAHG